MITENIGWFVIGILVSWGAREIISDLYQWYRNRERQKAWDILRKTQCVQEAIDSYAETGAFNLRADYSVLIPEIIAEGKAKRERLLP